MWISVDVLNHDVWERYVNVDYNYVDWFAVDLQLSTPIIFI
jgi:hypothetical protein